MTENYSPEELDRRVAIVGMACRTAGANSVEQLWENLKAGKASLTSLSDDELRAAGVPQKHIENPSYVRAGMFVDDPRGFDAGFFGFSPRDARILDPQHRHLMEICWEALEDGGYDPLSYSGSIGVFAGSGHNAYLPYNLLSNPEIADDIGFFLLRHTGNDKDFLPTRISYIFNLRGPSLAIQTACSTSLVCVHAAAQSLLSGECDMALAGGMTINLPLNNGYLFEEGGITSNDGNCRAFDADSTGTILGDGGGAVLLKRLEDAINDHDHIHGVIIGSAVNNDGSSKVNYLAPSVDGQSAAVSEAIEVADIAPESVSFIECHGTGTKIGDPIEIAALTQAYGHNNDKQGYCAVGSLKTNIGHTDTAAGVLGLIKAVMSVKTATLPPTVHFRSPNPEINFAESPFFVNDTLREWQSEGIRRAGVNSLGVGGTNAHVIIEEPPAPAVRKAKPWNIIALSAKSKPALAAARNRLQDHLAKNADVNLSDCEYTLIEGRQPMRHRSFAVVQNPADAIAVLADQSSDRWENLTAPGTSGGVVFMFAGGGAQHPNMGRDLYENQPVFREALEDCARVLRKHVDFDLLRLMYPEPDQIEASAAEMERPTRSLPCLFSMQYAQAMLWRSMGVEPDALIGHSMGENTALCVAGGITLEEGLSLVATRGRLQEQAPKGGMLSVFAKPESLTKFLTSNLSISVFNGPEMCVVSGPVGDLDTLEHNLEKLDIECQRVHINVAAHSPMLDPVLPEFKRHLQTFAYKAPTLPIASTFSGTWLTEEQAKSPDYWVDQLRNPVQFDQAIQLLLESSSDRIFLEVGPGNVMTSLAKQQPLAKGRQVMPSSRHRNADINDEAFMLTSLARLWASDATIDWQKFFERHPIGRIALPTYPFEHTEYWVSPGNSASGSSASADERKPSDQWFYQPSWQALPSPEISDRASEQVCVVVVGGNAFQSQLSTELAAYGYTVSTCKAGTPDELKLQLATSAERHPNGIIVVHADGLAPISLDQAGMDATFFSLWDTIKVLTELDVGNARLAILTHKSLRTILGEKLPGSMAATMLGVARVIPKEYPDISVRFVDTDLTIDQPKALATATVRLATADILENVEAEFRAAPWTKLKDYEHCKVISYRAGQRFEEAISQASAMALSTGRQDFAGKHILISGGLGSLGLEAARYLAAKGCSHVSLLARNGLPDRSDWSSYRDQSSRIRQRIAAIEEMEASGIGVSVFKADVTDRTSLKEAHQAAVEAGGPINGVLHAAGTLDDQLIQLKTRERAAAVIAPKVLGAVNLVEELREQPLDFVVFYSSVSAYLGAAGQSDYAAANAFLDSYASDLVARGIHATSINWPIWQDVGMAADLASGRRTAGSGFAAFEPRLRDNTYEVCLGTADWILNEHRTRAGLPIVPGTALIQLVHTAHKKLSPGCSGQPVTIYDMSLYAPISVADGEQLVAAVRFGSTGEDFEILSSDTPTSAASNEWAGEHVQGRISTESPRPRSPIDLAELQQRLEIAPEIIAGGMVSPFMTFGGRWQCLKDYRTSGNEMFAELELPAQYEADLSNNNLHPALLDTAIAGLQSLLHHRDNPNEFLIPMAYKEITVFGPLPRHVFSHVVAVETQENDQKAFDITVCDTNGRVLIEIKRFTMKVGDARSLDTAPATATSTGVELDFSGGITTDEGQIILDQLAGNPIYSQVIVSPVDFDAVLRKAKQSAQPAVGVIAGSAEPELSSDYVAPETEVQQKLSEIWCKGLGLNRIGINDNFFELGGHSLLLTQLASRMKKELKAAPKTSSLFATPTIAAWAKLAETIDASSIVDPAAKQPIKRISRDAYRKST